MFAKFWAINLVALAVQKFQLHPTDHGQSSSLASRLVNYSSRLVLISEVDFVFKLDKLGHHRISLLGLQHE